MKDNSPSAGELLEKIRETELRVAQLINQIGNPERTLEEKIRLNINRGRLESYAAGLRYAIDGSTVQPTFEENQA